MIEDPLVSVIIPIYEVESYINQTIESVKTQTYRNLEIILVDDGSPDNSGSICDSQAITDERINVIHKKNGGVSSARNAGLDSAKGDYILFIDGDDWIDKDHVEYLLSLCSDNNASMSMSYGIHTSRAVDLGDKDTIKVIKGIDMAADFLYHKTIIGSYNKLFSRGLVYGNNIRFNENLFIGEGFNFIVMCAQLSDVVATGNRKTYHYRRDNENSAMTKFSIDKIHNNDIALDIIKNSFVVESLRLTKAWNYAKWMTSLSFSVWLRISRKNKDYRNEYKKMIKDIQSRSSSVLFADVSLRKRVLALATLISPELVVRTLEYRRRRNV